MSATTSFGFGDTGMLRPMRNGPPLFTRPPNPGPAPAVAVAGGFGVGGGAGLSANADSASGHVRCRVGTGAAGAGAVTLIWPGDIPQAAGGVWAAADWATVGVVDSPTADAPSLDLNFMVPGAMDPRVTFTRASSGTYFDATGVMRSAVSNAPRWDYDPVSHALRGVLIEESRTNLVLNSGNAAAWNEGGNISAPPTVTANQTVAPDGTLTAARVAWPAVSAAMAYSLLNPVAGYTVPTAAPYVMSVWMKGAVGGESVYLSTTPDGSAYYRTLVTLTTSWQRFSLITGNLSATFSWYFEIGTDLRDPSQSPTPAQTIYTWGAQVEQGAFATSYIATGATTVVRAMDVCQMPVGAWFNPNAYSLMFEIIPFVPPNNYGGLSDAGFDPTTSYFGNSSYTCGGANTNANLPANAVSKQCAAVNPTSFNRLSNNGAPVTAIPISIAPQTGATRLAMGNDPWSLTTAMGGTMRHVRCWSRVLSDAELVTATTAGHAVTLNWTANRALVAGELARLAYEWSVAD